MIDGGVDAIEIGYPYSDPVMDGPVIQSASEEAINNGAGVSEVFELLKTSVDFGAPSVVMSYWSPIEKYGVDRFAHEVAENGGSGIITPDLTYEESNNWKIEAEKNSLNRIYVVAPSSSNDRLAKVTNECSGFIYAASLMGVTGARSSVSVNAKQLVERIRSVSNKPIAVGLGVSTSQQAQEVATYADGVIVGSAFIKIVQEFGAGRNGLKRLSNLLNLYLKGLKVQDKFRLAQPWLTLLARLILGGVLIAAGALKVGNLQQSAMAVRAYELLPIWMANLFGYALPWIEIGIGLLLVLGALVRINGLLGALIMLAFIIAIAQAWARGLSIDCGCFGNGEKLIQRIRSIYLQLLEI